MPSAWVEHIKEFAKRKGLTYGCALSDAECKAEYHAKKPPKTSKSAGGAKSAGGENISMEIAEKKPRGRPKKYATDEERKKAKTAKTIESNKRKKASKFSTAGAEKLEMAVPDMSVKPKGVVIKPRPAPVEKDITTYPKMIDAFTLKLEKEVKKFEKIKSFKSEKAYEDAKLFYKKIAKEHTDITQGKEKDDYFKAKYGANSLETGWANNGEDKDTYWDNGKIRDKQSKLFHDLYIAIADKDKRSAGKGVSSSKVAPAPAPPTPEPYPTTDPKNPYARRKPVLSEAKREKMAKEMEKRDKIDRDQAEEARRKEAEAEFIALKESREKPTGKGMKGGKMAQPSTYEPPPPTPQPTSAQWIYFYDIIFRTNPTTITEQDYTNMIEANNIFFNGNWNTFRQRFLDWIRSIFIEDGGDPIAEAQALQLLQNQAGAEFDDMRGIVAGMTGNGMKGGMFPKDFMDGIGKSAGGARRDTTPPPTRPLSQAQGDAILRAINLPKKRRGRELGRVLDDIEGGGDMERMVRRFEGFVSGSRQPPLVRKIMLKFRRAYDESMGGATDSEGTDSSGAGAGFNPQEKMADYLGKVEAVLPPPLKRYIRQSRETKKLLDDNKAKIMAENKANGSYGGGLLAPYKAEDAGGLTHIYPLSHAHILEMCKHLI